MTFVLSLSTTKRNDVTYCSTFNHLSITATKARGLVTLHRNFSLLKTYFFILIPVYHSNNCQEDQRRHGAMPSFITLLDLDDTSLIR